MCLHRSLTSVWAFRGVLAACESFSQGAGRTNDKVSSRTDR